MPTITPPPHPVRKPGQPWTADSLAAELIWQDWLDDWWQQYLHLRLVALEEALCSRRARRRLRRAIRRSVADYAWAGESFTTRRIEDVSMQYLCRDDQPGAGA